MEIATRALRHLSTLALMAILLPAVAAGPAGAAEAPRPEYSVHDLVDSALATADSLTYTIRTTLATPEGDIVRERTGLVQVVLPLGIRADVANRVDVGDGDSTADVDADVWVNPLDLNQVEIDLRRVGGALPLRVELVLDLPDGVNGATFGYDTRDTQHPRRMTTTVSFDGSATSSTVDAQAVFADATSPLTVLAELFGRRPDGTTFDPTTAAVTLDPVPTRLGFSFATDDVAGTTVVNLTASAPTTAVAAITDVKGNRTRTLDATIDQVPTSTTVTATSDPVAKTVDVTYVASAPISVVDATATDTIESGSEAFVTARAEHVPTRFAVNAATTADTVDGVPSETTVVTYDASARLGDLAATLRLTDAADSTTEVAAHLTDLPTSVTAMLQTIGVNNVLTEPDDRARIIDLTLASSVGDPVIGQAELGFAEDDTVRLLDPVPFFDDGELSPNEPVGYLFDADSSVALRVNGLRTTHVELGKPVLVDDEFQRPITAHVEAASQPFLVHQQVDGKRLDATILRLPTVIDLEYDIQPNGDFTAGYSGNAAIERSEVFLSTPRDGEIDPRTADIHLDGIPGQLTVSQVAGLLTATVIDDTTTPSVIERVSRIEASLNGNPVPSPLPASDGALELRITPEQRLAADEDGVVLHEFDPNPDDAVDDRRTSVYARVANLTALEFREDAAVGDIDAPDDRQSFQEGSPMPVGAVPTVHGQVLTSDVGASISRAPADGDGSQRPVGVRLHDSTEPKVTYVETRLEAPPDTVSVGFITQHKRTFSLLICNPETGRGCERFFQPCAPASTLYCEDVLMIDYEATGPSGTLALNTNTGDRENLFLTAPSLPDDVELCVATDGTCTDHAADFAVTSLSMRLMASSPLIDVEIRDCVEEAPGDEAGVCERGGVGLDDEAVFGDDDNQYLSGVLESVRFLEVEASPPPADEQPVGHLFINTTGRRFIGDSETGRDPDPVGEHTLDGILKIRRLAVDPSCDDTADDGSLKRMRLRFDQASANQRIAPLLLSGGCTLVTGASVPEADSTGTMTCPGNTEIDLAPNLEIVPAPPPLFFIDPGELRNEICTSLG